MLDWIKRVWFGMLNGFWRLCEGANTPLANRCPECKARPGRECPLYCYGNLDINH